MAQCQERGRSGDVCGQAADAVKGDVAAERMIVGSDMDTADCDGLVQAWGARCRVACSPGPEYIWAFRAASVGFDVYPVAWW